MVQGILIMTKSLLFLWGDYGIYLTYSRRIIENLTVGGSVKVITRRAGDINVNAGFEAKSWGFGIDLGAVYQIKDFKIGLAFKRYHDYI
jgi:hypothetical protein